MAKFPLIEINGNPKEIGTAHGEMLKGRIHQTISYYKKIFRRPVSEIFLHARHFKKSINKLNPNYGIEIEAIANASEVDPLWIYTLNSRSEILSMFVTECTSFYTKDSNLLAQNWDWGKPLEELAVLMKIKDENDNKILMMTEPGIIGKIGFNSRGLGVCLNFLYSNHKLDGLPIHITLRKFLEMESLEELRLFAENNYYGKSGNILAATTHGEYIDFEFSGNHLFQNSGENNFVHTNHYLHDENLNFNREKLESSKNRYKRAVELISERKITLSDAKSILLDNQNTKLPICRPFISDIELGEAGTVCSIIMDLHKKLIHITPGNPIENDFIQFQL